MLPGRGSLISSSNRFNKYQHQPQKNLRVPLPLVPGQHCGASLVWSFNDRFIQSVGRSSQDLLLLTWGGHEQRWKKHPFCWHTTSENLSSQPSSSCSAVKCRRKDVAGCLRLIKCQEFDGVFCWKRGKETKLSIYIYSTNRTHNKWSDAECELERLHMNSRFIHCLQSQNIVLHNIRIPQTSCSFKSTVRGGFLRLCDCCAKLCRSATASCLPSSPLFWIVFDPPGHPMGH